MCMIASNKSIILLENCPSKPFKLNYMLLLLRVPSVWVGKWLIIHFENGIKNLTT